MTSCAIPVSFVSILSFLITWFYLILVFFLSVLLYPHSILFMYVHIYITGLDLHIRENIFFFWCGWPCLILYKSVHFLLISWFHFFSYSWITIFFKCPSSLFAREMLLKLPWYTTSPEKGCLSSRTLSTNVREDATLMPLLWKLFERFLK